LSADEWFFYLTILIIFFSLVCNSFFILDTLMVFDIEVNDIRNSLATSFIVLPAVKSNAITHLFFVLILKKLETLL